MWNVCPCNLYQRYGALLNLLKFVGDTIYAANLGDSRAVMGCKGKIAHRLTQDHKPGDPDEIKRIEVYLTLLCLLILKDLGGFVKIKKTARVQGMLAVSRALGDKKFIPYVSSDPSVTKVSYTCLVCPYSRQKLQTTPSFWYWLVMGYGMRYQTKKS